jgi:hypothetical protein
MLAESRSEKTVELALKPTVLLLAMLFPVTVMACELLCKPLIAE